MSSPGRRASTNASPLHGREADTAKDLQDILNWADSLPRPPSRSYHYLRAQAYRLVGDPTRAAEHERLANDRSTPVTALDHFLQGERHRAEGVHGSKAAVERVTWQPNPDLLKRAVEEYRLALQIDPKHYWSHLQAGRCYLSLGQGLNALEALGTCVSLEPDTVWAYSVRGLALALRKDFRGAEQDLEKAFRLDPDFCPARLNLGVIQWLQEKHDDALATFTAVLEAPAGKRLLEAAYYRGQLYAERGKYPEALRDLSRVVDENPGFGPAYLLRGRVYLLQGHPDQGLADLNSFLAAGQAFDPKCTQAYAQRGRLLRLLLSEFPAARQKEHVKLALGELAEALRLGGPTPRLCGDLGAVLELLGGMEEAILAYSRGLEKAPGDIELLVKRGWAYAKQRQDEKAEADFTRAVHLDPAKAEVHTGLGYFLARRKKHPEAQREAAHALLHGADDYLVLHNVACIYAALAQSDLARAPQHESTAVALLRRALEQWKSAAGGPSEIDLIRTEPAFPDSLRESPEFRELLDSAGRAVPSAARPNVGGIDPVKGAVAP